MKPYKEITEVTELSKTDFCKNYLDVCEPVVIRGGAKETPAYKKLVRRLSEICDRFKSCRRQSE
jgi:hypothetical protein